MPSQSHIEELKVSGTFFLLEVWGPLTYSSLSLSSFCISHRFLSTDASRFPRSLSVRFRLSHFSLFVTYFAENFKEQNTGDRIQKTEFEHRVSSIEQQFASRQSSPSGLSHPATAWPTPRRMMCRQASITKQPLTELNRLVSTAKNQASEALD